MNNKLPTFQLEIITLERIAYQNEINMVIVPGISGVLGILAHHTPLFTALVEGELKIVKGGEEQYLAIGGGFMEVTPSKVTILVTRAVHAEEINEAQVLEAKKNAEEILEKKPTGEDLVAAQALFRRSLLDLKILRRRRPSKIPS